jgi:quinoprotein glucose dehydrogenase
VAIGVSAGGVPSIYKNVAIVGASSTENPQEGNAIGNPRAFDVVTGKKLWEFQTVPKAGEKYNETWGPNGWQNRQGTNMWGFAAPIDYDRGIAYLPIAGPAANYYGGDRPGINVHGTRSSRYAQTGKGTSRPCITICGTRHAERARSSSQRQRPPVARDRARREDELLLVLNRENGNPLIKVEEKPVPKGDADGVVSPTQPFPVKPESVVPTSFNKDTDMGGRKTHAGACRCVRRRGSRRRLHQSRSVHAVHTRAGRRRSRRSSCPAAPGA